MSMMRASGAMPMITALQMATASFALPKSVMNTIDGFRVADAVVSFGAGALAQPGESPRSRNGSARSDLFCSHGSMRFPLFEQPVYAFQGRSLAFPGRAGHAVFV